MFHVTLSFYPALIIISGDDYDDDGNDADDEEKVAE